MRSTDLAQGRAATGRAGSWWAVAWCVLLTVSWWALVPRSLALPDPAVDPFATATTLLRFGAATLLVRLTAATALAVVGSLTQSSTVVRSAIRLAPRAARTSLARWSAPGLLLASTALAGTVGTGTAALAGPVPTGSGTSVVTTSVPTGETGPVAPPTMRRQEGASTATDAAPPPTPGPPSPSAAPADASPHTGTGSEAGSGSGTGSDSGTGAAQTPGPSVEPSARPEVPDASATEDSSAPAPGVATWTIEPGQHLWLVAATTLEQRLGGPVDLATTARYHQAVVALNRDRLADPDNPDLVFAGQVIELPATPPAP